MHREIIFYHSTLSTVMLSLCTTGWDLFPKKEYCRACGRMEELAVAGTASRRKDAQRSEYAGGRTKADAMSQYDKDRRVQVTDTALTQTM